MVSIRHTTLLSAIAIVATLSHAQAADTLADMDIEVSPELQAQGIDPGVKHMNIGGRWQAASQAAGIMAMLAMIGQAGLPSEPVVVGDSIMFLLGDVPGFRNLAVNGRQTPDILATLETLPRNTPVVYIEGGVNDLVHAHASDAEIIANYQRMIAQAPAGAQIRVFGILPVPEQRLTPDVLAVANNAKIASIDSAIANVCAANPRCAMVPSPFTKPVGNGDGVHPSAAEEAQLKAAIHR